MTTEPPPCGHEPMQRGCGGCDPGADEFVIEDGTRWLLRHVNRSDYEVFSIAADGPTLNTTLILSPKEDPVADYTWRTITTQRHEWLVPIRGLWGAAIVEFNKAQHNADRVYREKNGLKKADSVPDDYLRVTFDDDHVIIFFETEVK